MTDQQDAIVEHSLGLLEKTIELLQKNGLPDYAGFIATAFQNCLDTYISEQGNGLRDILTNHGRPKPPTDES
ncbi:hypothetical protein [Asticcacaulis sp. W401b]|uniref:hypothetical protein n=1 Tax=Asticcacaulis sp. W401b TaxID=3388666 RepID=UPI003970B664